MENFSFSRRGFLGALGAIAVCPSYALDDTPRLRFGVASDIHVSLFENPDPKTYKPDAKAFLAALRYFSDQGVDAVMVPGDLTNRGSVEELEAVAKAWATVFPGDRAPDGRKVERLFVYGNHDYHGYLYGNNWGKQTYPDEAERWRHVLRADMKGFWERTFHEEYRRIWSRTVKGYTFIGSNWDDGKGPETNYGHDASGEQLREFFANPANVPFSDKPFFYFQHAHPRGTVIGPEGISAQDNGISTEVLSHYPNAVVFSGHSHYSIADERSIWQGGFTSINAGSLRYAEADYARWAERRYENWTASGKRAAEIDKLKKTERIDRCSSHGLLVDVFEDHLVVRRLQFVPFGEIAAAWVVPLLPKADGPFSFALRAKAARAPEFAPGQKLSVTDEGETVKLEFPQAIARSDARPFDYEIAVRGGNGDVRVFYALTSGYNHAPTHRKYRRNMTVVLDRSELPSGPLHYSVKPMDVWKNVGRPIEG